MAFDAGTITGHLTLEKGGFTAGILEAQGMTELLGPTISSFLANPMVGIANAAREAISAIKELIVGTAEAGENFGKLSMTTGASVEFLSGLSHAANMADVGMDELGFSMNLMARAAADAAGGNATAASAFTKLGVAVTDSTGHVRNGQELFLAVADGLKAIENPAERAAAAQDIFGRQAAKLIPLLAQGSEGINGFIAQAQQMGLVMDEAGVEKSNKFNDAIKGLFDTFKGLGQTLAMPFLDTFGPMLEQLTTAIIPALLPVVQALGQVWQAIAPNFGSAVELCGSLAGLVAAVLVPALELLAPILRLVSAILTPILQMLKQMVDWIAGPLRAVGSWLGANNGSSTAPAATPTGSGQTTVNVLVSPEDSARRVADKLAPAIVSSVKGVQTRLETASQRQMAVRTFETSLALR